MRRVTILHSEFLRLLASCGRGDLLVVSDTERSIPPTRRCLHLARVPGQPATVGGLQALLSEDVVEQHALAADAGLPGVHIVEPPSHALPGLSPDWRLHRNRNLVQLTSLARTVVRSAYGKVRPVHQRRAPLRGCLRDPVTRRTLVAGVDSSTQGTKVLVVEAESGVPVASGQPSGTNSAAGAGTDEVVLLHLSPRS